MLDWRPSLRKPRKRVISGKQQEIYIVSDFSHSSNTQSHKELVLLTRFYFLVSLAMQKNNLAFYRDSADFKNARSCLARTKETKMDGADLSPRKSNVCI